MALVRKIKDAYRSVEKVVQDIANFYASVNTA